MNVMDLRSIYIANGIGIFILIILRYACHARILRNNKEDKLFSFIVYGVMAGCFFEAFSYNIDGRIFPFSRILNYIANTYLYSFNLLLPLGVLIYSDLRLYDNWDRIRKLYKPHFIIAAVMIALNIVNFFTPIIYDISPDNIYSRRPLSYSFYAVIVYYLVSVVILTRRYEKENGTRAFLNIYIFLLPVLTGVALQFLFYGLSLAWVSSAIGLVGLFMMQQNELAYIDPLVGAYNRQYLNSILSSWISREIPFSGIMADIDNFKGVNDTFGHSEGDRILKTVTDILQASRKDQEWVFRFAGDEFVILKKGTSEDDLSGYIEEVNRRIADFNRQNPSCQLSLSYGTSIFRTGELDSFMKEMDSRMYEMKEKHHNKVREA